MLGQGVPASWPLANRGPFQELYEMGYQYGVMIAGLRWGDGLNVVAGKGRQSGTYKRPIGVVNCCDGEETIGASLAVLYRAASTTQRYLVSSRLCRRRMQLRNR